MSSPIRQVRPFGFNLLECILACFIFSMAALALAVIWPTLTHGTVKGRHRLVALHLSNQILENYTVLSRAKTALKDDMGVYKISSTSNSVTTESEYQYKVETHPLDVGLTDVVVTISWTYQGTPSQLKQEVVLRNS